MNLQCTNEYSKAYVEILEIINYMGKTYKEKIPSKLINFFQENKAIDYKYELKFLDSGTSFLKETMIILVLIEQKYWATDNEREMLTKVLEKNQEKYEKDLNEKYNPNKLFENKDLKIEKQSITDDTIDTTESMMIEYKEPIFSKIKNWLRKIFINEK